MLLYNVTFDISDLRTVLVPGIPETAAEDEDKSIARVCLTDSVEHCMQAIATGRRHIKKGAIITVRSVDSDELDKQFLLEPEVLRQRMLVPDALENNEYWYLGVVRFKHATYEIIDYTAEYDLAWTCINIEDCKRIINRYLQTFNTSVFNSSKEMYEAAMHYCDYYSLWNEQDKIWDDLAELPWAQKITINSLELKEIELSNSVPSCDKTGSAKVTEKIDVF